MESLKELSKIAQFLQKLSRDDLKGKAALLVVNKFPDLKHDAGLQQDVAGLIRYERQRRSRDRVV
jgi:hypothetical protein